MFVASHRTQQKAIHVIIDGKRQQKFTFSDENDKKTLV
jgi:hypothetical protein